MTADAAADTAADTAKNGKNADKAAKKAARLADKAAKAKAGTGGRRPGLPKDRNVLILGAVCAVLLVATAVLAFFYVMQEQDNSARSAATSAATADVPKILSYTFSSFSTDMAKGEAVSTPAFRTQYEKDMNGVKSMAQQNQVVTSTAVTNSSVISSSGSKVALLMFLSMQTKTKAKAESVLNSPAVRVTMRNEGGKWLIDAVTPHP